MDVLLSIKPIYVRRISNGEKKFEFRKKIFKNEPERVFIYSSAPEKRIIGYFPYLGFLSNTPTEIWKRTSQSAGIAMESYHKYFHGKSIAYALIIDQLVVFSDPIDPFFIFDNFKAPQSLLDGCRKL